MLMFIYRYIDIASMQDEDDFMLRQFMRTRDHHIGKTWAMLFQYLSLKHAPQATRFNLRQRELR
jgi:hypothetical protein